MMNQAIDFTQAMNSFHPFHQRRNVILTIKNLVYQAFGQTEMELEAESRIRQQRCRDRSPNLLQNLEGAHRIHRRAAIRKVIENGRDRSVSRPLRPEHFPAGAGRACLFQHPGDCRHDGSGGWAGFLLMDAEVNRQGSRDIFHTARLQIQREQIQSGLRKSLPGRFGRQMLLVEPKGRLQISKENGLEAINRLFGRRLPVPDPHFVILLDVGGQDEITGLGVQKVIRQVVKNNEGRKSIRLEQGSQLRLRQVVGCDSTEIDVLSRLDLLCYFLVAKERVIEVLCVPRRMEDINPRKTSRLFTLGNPPFAGHDIPPPQQFMALDILKVLFRLLGKTSEVAIG